jgi:hypothetical protein
MGLFSEKLLRAVFAENFPNDIFAVLLGEKETAVVWIQWFGTDGPLDGSVAVREMKTGRLVILSSGRRGVQVTTKSDQTSCYDILFCYVKRSDRIKNI